MATYSEIQAAYASAFDTSTQLRDTLFELTRRLWVTLKEVGNFPEGKILCHSPQETKVNREKKLSPQGATTVNEEENCWEFGIVVELSYKENSFPKEYFMNVFQMRPVKQSEINLSLKGYDLSINFNRGDLEQQQEELETFVGKSLDSISEFYLSRGEVLEQESAKDQIGFHTR